MYLLTKKNLFLLGPNYLDTLEDTELAVEGISKSILFNYNAKACEDNICFDNSPAQSTESAINAKLSSVVLSVTRDVKNQEKKYFMLFTLIFLSGKGCNFMFRRFSSKYLRVIVYEKD